MKDVEALCKRAIIINHGKINHDGPLADIVDRFGRHKIMDLQFAGSEVPNDLGALRHGRRNAGPRACGWKCRGSEFPRSFGPVGQLQHRRRRRAGTATGRCHCRNVCLGSNATRRLRRRKRNSGDFPHGGCFSRQPDRSLNDLTSEPHPVSEFADSLDDSQDVHRGAARLRGPISPSARSSASCRS